MRRSFAPAVVVALLAACGTEVAGPAPGGDEAAPAGITTAPSSTEAGIRTGNDDTDGADDSDGADAPPTDDASPAPDGPDADNDAPADDAAPPADVSPPPADVSQSCSVWQDCGPHFGDLNSGFDCDGGQCACNVAGDHDDACRAIGGYWSDAECFCFVTSSRPPEEADRDTTDHVTCWWDWYEECDADVWVDTSYYRRECDSSGRCRDVYVRRGYWRDGHCDDIWVRECSDGTRQEYR